MITQKRQLASISSVDHLCSIFLTATLALELYDMGTI